MFDEMKKALEKGKIIALKKDTKTGAIVFGGAFENDRDATAIFDSADTPEKMACLPEIIFVKNHLTGAPHQR